MSSPQDGNADNESSGASSAEKGSTAKQETSDRESSTHAESGSLTGHIPYARFQQVVRQKNESGERLNSVEAELTRLKDENDALKRNRDLDVSEGIKPFVDDIDKVAARRIAESNQKIEQLTQVVDELRNRELFKFVQTEEDEIRKSLSGKRGRRTYDEVLPEIQKIVKENPHRVVDVKKLYLDLTQKDVDKYIESLEGKAGTQKSDKGRQNTVHPSSSASSAPIQGSKNFREMLTSAARQGRETLQTAE
jgi:hypothetical protein